MSVDKTTGEITCPRCGKLTTEQLDDVEDAWKKVGQLERQIAKLKRQVKAAPEEERQAHPHRRLIVSLIDRWRRATGHPNAKLSADRFDLVKARMADGYEPEQIQMAIDGIAAYPYVIDGQRKANGKPSQRFDRLGIAIGSGEKLEQFANLAAMNGSRNGSPSSLPQPSGQDTQR